MPQKATGYSGALRAAKLIRCALWDINKSVWILIGISSHKTLIGVMFCLIAGLSGDNLYMMSSWLSETGRTWMDAMRCGIYFTHTLNKTQSRCFVCGFVRVSVWICVSQRSSAHVKELIHRTGVPKANRHAHSFTWLWLSQIVMWWVCGHMQVIFISMTSCDCCVRGSPQHHMPYPHASNIKSNELTPNRCWPFALGVRKFRVCVCVPHQFTYYTILPHPIPQWTRETNIICVQIRNGRTHNVPVIVWLGSILAWPHFGCRWCCWAALLRTNTYSHSRAKPTWMWWWWRDFLLTCGVKPHTHMRACSLVGTDTLWSQAYTTHTHRLTLL